MVSAGLGVVGWGAQVHQSSPRVIIQILIAGSQIFGKALFEAGRQAVRNAKHRPLGAAGDVAGVDKATTGSATDRLTREHRMTVDEAHLILNVKRGEEMEQVLRNYEHLFQANANAVEEGARPGRGAPQSSHYLQSKVVRARERIEAEVKIASEPPEAAAGEGGSTSGPASGSASEPPPPREK